MYFKPDTEYYQSPSVLNLGMEMAGTLYLEEVCQERAFIQLLTASLTIYKPKDKSVCHPDFFRYSVLLEVEVLCLVLFQVLLLE